MFFCKARPLLTKSLLSFFSDSDRESEGMENDLDYLENLRELLQSHSQKYVPNGSPHDIFLHGLIFCLPKNLRTVFSSPPPSFIFYIRVLVVELVCYTGVP